MKTHHQVGVQIHQVLIFKPPLVFRVMLAKGKGRGTQEGRRSSALFSILYLYDSERVVREKCRGVGSLLPACTPTDAATFFEFSKYSWFLSLVLYLVYYMLVVLVVE